jgi:hypothetical protein
MADSIEVTALAATHKQARDVYEKLVQEEQATLAHLDDIRARRLRQEGFVGALEYLLRPNSVPTAGQEPDEDSVEALYGTQEEQQEEVGQLDRVGAQGDGAEGHNRLAAQGARQKRGRDNHRG